MDIAENLKDNSLSHCFLLILNCEDKERKAFRYFSCDFVKEIYFHDISDTCPYYINDITLYGLYFKRKKLISLVAE